MGITYKDSGVDIEAGYNSVKLIKEHVSKTFKPQVLSDIGGFSGLYELNKNKYNEPVLVSGTDGVGTKLKIAFLMDKHDTVGIDCVAMCVNDIVCCGAKPLFFLDYIAVGKNYPDKISDIVKGFSDGCIISDCSLIGGETAEMPGFYNENEYDLAGFAVGVVEKASIINGNNIKEGNKIIGLSSSGLHSNGYSLVRKLLNLNAHKINEFVHDFGTTLGEELIKPTKIYVKTVLDLIEKYKVNGISHITGGGFFENIPRIIPEGYRAVIKKGSWPLLNIFSTLLKWGNIDENTMYSTFNMGIGMTLVVDKEIAADILNYLNSEVEQAYIIGEIQSGGNGVIVC